VKLLEETPAAVKAPRKKRIRMSAGDTATEAAHKELSRLFKLLADETRLSILLMLVDVEEYHVRALCDMLGQSQPAVSHHLALLRMAGLIECRRAGKHNFYRLSPKRFEELLESALAGARVSGDRIRLGKYVLSREA
jgi:ArsR family transcriptional regulator